jgi:hypothetical protein
MLGANRTIVAQERTNPRRSTRRGSLSVFRARHVGVRGTERDKWTLGIVLARRSVLGRRVRRSHLGIEALRVPCCGSQSVCLIEEDASWPVKTGSVSSDTGSDLKTCPPGRCSPTNSRSRIPAEPRRRRSGGLSSLRTAAVFVRSRRDRASLGPGRNHGPLIGSEWPQRSSPPSA